MITQQEYWFPHPEESDGQGLLAMGGDLSPSRLLQAYSRGIFPWYEPGRPILWWSPHPRLILLPQNFKFSKSLKKSFKKPFTYTIDTAFTEVICACATTSGRKDNTWISKEMQEAYIEMHRLGYAHSFEVWEHDKLVGGLYGVSLGKAFFGESMFHYVTDASKLAFHFLCKTLCEWEFELIDCQMPTTHLLTLGAEIISRKHFLYLLAQALSHPDKVGVWNGK